MSAGTARLCTPPRRPSTLQRLIGTIRREYLDWVIPMSEDHLRTMLREWVAHYNAGRPHASLGPAVPDGAALVPVSTERRIPDGHCVVAKSILGGLHHEYRLERAA